MAVMLPMNPTILGIDGRTIVVSGNSDDWLRMLNWTENITYGLDLSKDWANSTLSFIQTSRPSDAPGLIDESLWFDDKRDSIYCYWGMRSYARPTLNSLSPPIETIWGFQHNDDGSAAWHSSVRSARLHGRITFDALHLEPLLVMANARTILEAFSGGKVAHTWIAHSDVSHLLDFWFSILNHLK